MSQSPKEVPSVFFLPTPPRAAEAAMERWQLQFQASASRGQQSSTRGEVWRPCMAQPSPLLAPAGDVKWAPAGDVKWALSHLAHKNQGKRLQHNPAGGKLPHSLIRSFIQ